MREQYNYIHEKIILFKTKKKIAPHGGGVVVWSCPHSWALVALLPPHPLLALGVIALVFGPGVVIWHPSTRCPPHISIPSHPMSHCSWQWLGVWL